MDETFTIRDILAAFFRQYKVFCSALLFALLIGVLVIIYSIPLYQSSGSLLVKFGSDADSGVNKTEGVQLSANDRREIMQSNLDILQSHDLLKSVITNVGIERIYPGITKTVEGKDSPLGAAIKRMENSHLTIKSSQQSNIIDLSVLNPDPEVATQIVGAIQDIFIARQLEIFNKPQTIFLQEQVKLAEENLSKSQQALSDFKSSVGVSSIEEELNELLKQKSTAATVAFQAVDDAQNKLAELRDKETEMLTTYKSGSPVLVAIRKSIAEAERQLRERQNDLDTSSKKSALSKQNISIDRRIHELEEQRSKHDDLLRQVQMDETNYKNYLARSEDARVGETLGEKKITRVVIVDEPSAPVRPVSPRKTLILASSFLAGVMLGSILIIIMEIFDESFRTPKQLAKTIQSPVLASFPKNGALVQLFNNIEHLLIDTPQPIIQIASSYDGEDVDKIARDLAKIATQQGKNILLIDTEKLRKNFKQTQFDFANIHNNSWTIITSSGLLHDELSQSLTKLTNGSVLIVEAERTRAPVVKEMKRLISSLGGKVIGTVLVGRRLYIPETIYNLLYKTNN